VIVNRPDLTAKGVPFALGDTTGWSLFRADATFPAAVLLRSALERNSASMALYCRRSGVSLAPHGKTTMSPELFSLQVRDGAWAVTAANVHQARVMRDSGVPRVLIANEVTAPGDIAWLAEQVGSGFPVMCYVDSVAGVRLLDEGLARSGSAGRQEVLVELGVVGGRTGVRSVDDAVVVARAAAASPVLRVVGVSGFEGIIGAAGGVSAEQRVDDFLGRLADLAEAIAAEGLTGDADELVVSAGGSVYFDRVVKVLTQVRAPMPVRVVVRSGCYLTHDDGVIHELSPLGMRPRVDGDVFHAALEVWAPVLSRPEPTRLIVGAGKRDISTDGLPPVAKKWVRRGTRDIRPIDSLPRASKVDDQHAYIDVDASSPIAVGDYVGLGVSHPCTTFDKWKVLWVVDDTYDVVDVVTTRF
jgi:D-serine deaminase-like pyridoxal phosphate-dependent protein